MKCDWLGAIDTSTLRGKKVLIAGGTGFIGKRCVELLEIIGCNVTVLTRKEKESSEKVIFIKSDLINHESLLDLFAEEKFDFGIYMAANIPLLGDKKETYLDAKRSTLDPFVNFCDVFLNKIQSFVYVSSIDIVGNVSKDNYDETEPLNNPTPYGLAKYCGENYTKVMCKNLGIPYKILRFSQVYGPNEPVVRIIAILKQSLLSGKEFNLFTEGTEKRKFLFIDDVVQSIIRCFLSEKTGIYNIAGPDCITMLDLISVMVKVFDKKLNLNLLKKIKGNSNIPSINKAETELEFIPNFSIQEGLQIIKEEENI